MAHIRRPLAAAATLNAAIFGAKPGQAYEPTA